MKAEDYIKRQTPKIKKYVSSALKAVNCLSEADDVFQQVCIKLYRKYPEKKEDEYNKMLLKICTTTAIDTYRSKNNVKSKRLRSVSISNLLVSDRGEESDLELEAIPDSIPYEKIELIIDYYIEILSKRYVFGAQEKDVKSNKVHLQVFRRTCYGERQKDIFADFPNYKDSTLRGAIGRMRNYLAKEIKAGRVMTFDDLLEE